LLPHLRVGNALCDVTIPEQTKLEADHSYSFMPPIQVRKEGGKNAGRVYAMKVLRKSTIIREQQVQHTKTERRILAHLKHPFVVDLVYSFQMHGMLYMVLEYLAGGDLFSELEEGGHFSESIAQYIPF
jgi:serine/threonine protein kinase